MPQNAKLEVVRQMLESAEGNLRSAKQLLAELTGVQFGPDYTKRASTVGAVAEGGRVVEGVFDGKDMIGPDKRKYPVPANYASKSKLVAGDILKLTITDDGSYIYKQIGPVPRRKMVGTLSQEGNQYRVLASGKSYSVLLASVTYFKANSGDQVSIIVPEEEESEWAAVDNLLVRPVGGTSPQGATEGIAEDAPEGADVPADPAVAENAETPETVPSASE